jgi:DNA-binding protein H-NS
MSATYAELTKQIAELQRAAEAARKAETASAISQIQAIMNEYGLSVSDISGKGKSKSNKPKGIVAVQFKNPDTNETWTGRGRAPRWLDGKDKEAYRITA